jgi:hypothetical protein
MTRNVNEILDDATLDQVKWVMRRLTSSTDKEAAEAIGLSPSTVSRWDNKAELNNAVSLLLREPINAAVEMLRGAAVKAAQAIIDTMDTEDEKLKLTAANDLLDRIGMGQPETEINIKFDLDQWKSERQKRLDAIAQLPEVEGDAATDT